MNTRIDRLTGGPGHRAAIHRQPRDESPGQRSCLRHHVERGRARGRHLRTPFCRAYSKVPMPYRDSKLAPQAYACMHLGWSARKPGYTFEIMEGPQKGDVITSSQTKFRENVFPCHGQADAGVPREMDADLEPHDEPVVADTEELVQAGTVPTRRSARTSTCCTPSSARRRRHRRRARTARTARRG